MGPISRINIYDCFDVGWGSLVILVRPTTKSPIVVLAEVSANMVGPLPNVF